MSTLTIRLPAAQAEYRPRTQCWRIEGLRERHGSEKDVPCETMTALDTNVLVRLLAQDDDVQFRKVLQMLNRKRADFFVGDLVLAETDWVLRSLYNWNGDEVADAFGRLTTIHNLSFENEARLRSSLKALREGADLADELIVRSCRDHGAKSFATFDKCIVRRHKPFAGAPN